MKQTIIVGYPPLWDEILLAFPGAAQPGVIFSWGDRIFNPYGVPLPPSIIAHEAVHAEQQSNIVAGVVAWWRRYMDEPDFRLAQEIPAHQAELEVLCNESKSRNERRFHIKIVASRLCSPLYGRMISMDRAKAALKLRLAA